MWNPSQVQYLYLFVHLRPAIPQFFIDNCLISAFPAKTRSASLYTSLRETNEWNSRLGFGRCGQNRNKVEAMTLTETRPSATDRLSDHLSIA